jgi:hypothetical protein
MVVVVHEVQRPSRCAGASALALKPQRSELCFHIWKATVFDGKCDVLVRSGGLALTLDEDQAQTGQVDLRLRRSTSLGAWRHDNSIEESAEDLRRARRVADDQRDVMKQVRYAAEDIERN